MAASRDAREAAPGGTTDESFVVGIPLMVKDKDNVPVLLAVFASTTENNAWLEAAAGRTGESLWRFPAIEIGGRAQQSRRRLFGIVGQVSPRIQKMIPSVPTLIGILCVRLNDRFQILVFR
jgi:hypothetical protein